MHISLDTDICPIVNVGTYWTGLGNAISENSWEEFKNTLIAKATERITELLQATELHSATVKFGQFHTLSSYNYGDDYLDFDLDFDEGLLDVIRDKTDDGFFLWAGKNFGSYPGFASFYPITKKEFDSAIRDRKKLDLAISMFISWQIDKLFGLEKVKNDFLLNVTEMAFENHMMEDIEDEEKVS